MNILLLLNSGQDHSEDVDEDPLAPLVPALTVPNCVMMLHAILVNDSFSEIIEWMPHGWPKLYYLG